MDSSKSEGDESKRVVALCDILGFSHLLRTESLSGLRIELTRTFREALSYSIKQELPDRPPSLAELREEARVGVAWFSDAIVFYGLDDSNEAAHNVLEAVAWILFTTTLSGRFKLRIGIGYGEFDADVEDETFIGLGLLDAYEVERAQEWIGGALSKSAEDRFKNRLLSSPWLCDWTVPSHRDRTSQLSRSAINWCFSMHDPWQMPDWLKSESSIDELRVPQAAVVKYRNTFEFHARICPRCARPDTTQR